MNSVLNLFYEIIDERANSFKDNIIDI